MSKISLSLNGDRAFGKYLPSVFINTIAVRYREKDSDGADGPESSSDNIIDVTLNINLTKDKELNEPAEYIKKYLGDLCLYGWLNTMPVINEDIRQKKLHLKDLFQLYSASEHTLMSEFDSDDPAYDIVINQLKQQFASRVHWSTFANADHSARGTGDIVEEYFGASESQLLSALEDPETVWYYLFWGETGPDGPWGSHVEGSFHSDGDLVASKSLKWWPSSESKTTFDFESLVGDDSAPHMYKSWMSWHAHHYLAFYTAAKTSEYYDSDDINKLGYKIPLKDLLIKSDLDSDTSTPDENPYGADLWIQNVYDEEGNELIQINGIKLSFVYKDSDSILGRLDYHNVYFIGTIGIDVDRIDDESRATRSKDEFLYDSPRSLFNNYFGNISFEHVLEKNIVPTQYIELWEYASNREPYDDIPIQNLNGHFYETTPVGQTQIVDSFNSLIQHYSGRAESDRELKINLQKLSNLINLYATDVNLLTQLSIYRQTYFPRGPATPSGWFYRDFLSLLASLVTRIGVQERVLKRMARVGIVTDYRASIGGWYVAPHPSGPTTEDGSLTWLAFDREGDDFIPSVWTEMSRQTFETPSTFGYGLRMPSDYEELYNDIMESLQSRIAEWLRQGFTEEQIETWAQTAAYLAYHRGITDLGSEHALAWDVWDPDGGLGASADLSDLFWPERMSNNPEWAGAAVHSALRGVHQDQWLRPEFSMGQDMNTITMNRGAWWFEYEKALYTQSKIAHVIRLNLLGRFLRMRIPYTYFPVEEVKMIRRELELNVDGGTSGVGDYDVDRVSETTFITTMIASKNYPLSDYCNMNNTDGEDNLGYFIPEANILESRFDQGEYTEADASDLFADTPGVEYGRSSRTENSWLAFAPADTAVDHLSYLGEYGYGTETGDPGSGGDDSLVDQTLMFYGYAAADVRTYVSGSTSWSDGWEYDLSAVPMDTAIRRGLRVRNGYRLMCFEYQDMMDDDVAYYNTLYKSDPGRLETIEQINDGFDTTTYELEVKVTDKTLEWYTNDFYPWIEEKYEHFTEYYAFAEEFCTYNNITNQFNQFFIDAMKERYPTGSSKLWIQSALISVLLREILFQTVASEGWESGGMTEAELKEKIESDVLDLVKTISPEEGNLESLREFNCRYQLYLQLLKPQNFEGEFCDDYFAESPVFERACEMAGIDLESIDASDAWVDLATGTGREELTFTNRIPIDQPIFGNYILNSYLSDTVGFSSGMHPIALAGDMIWITAGKGSTNNSTKYKVYIQSNLGGFYPLESYYEGYDAYFGEATGDSYTPLPLDWGQIPPAFISDVLEYTDPGGADRPYDGVKLMFVHKEMLTTTGTKVVELAAGWRLTDISTVSVTALETLVVEVPYGISDYSSGDGGTWASPSSYDEPTERETIYDPESTAFSTGVQNWLHFRPPSDETAFSYGAGGEFLWNNYRDLWQR